MNIGKKILSALVELPEDERQPIAPSTNVNVQPQFDASEQDKFRAHFARLLEEANLPGPDYYEFVRMISAMHMLPEERSRFQAAFAGLQAQGLDKQRLVDSAQQYLRLLEEDAQGFQASLAAADAEKVKGREAELRAQQERIRTLGEELARLQASVAELQAAISTGSAKLESARAAYNAALTQEQGRIRTDLEKIQQHIS